MKNRATKYPCGQCNNDVGESSHSVFCRGIYTQWYHLKCTSLPLEEFKSMSKTNDKWFCDGCINVDVTVKQLK